MIGIVVAGHGEWPRALLGTARLVVPEGGYALAIEVQAQEEPHCYEARLKKAVCSVQKECGGGVLILTDMFGGTPANVGMTIHRADQVEVITGASLPMLIKALQLSDTAQGLLEMAQHVQQVGIRSIVIATEGMGRVHEHTRFEVRLNT